LVSQTYSTIAINCKPEELPSYYNSNINNSSDTFIPLNSKDIESAIKLCKEFEGLHFPFTYLKTVEDNGISSIILLRRNSPSTCLICKRIHEHENAYLIVAGEDRDVYLDCRRNAHNKKLFVGKLGKINNDSTPEVIKKASPRKKYLDSFTPPKPEIDLLKPPSVIRSEREVDFSKYM